MMSDSLVPDRIATTLNESEEGPRQRIGEIVAALGDSLALSLLEETQRIEDAGGEMTANGKRRRTAGGVFFKLAKKRLSSEDKKRIFRPPSKPTEGESEPASAPPVARPAPPNKEPLAVRERAVPRPPPIRVTPIAGPPPRPMPPRREEGGMRKPSSPRVPETIVLRRRRVVEAPRAHTAGAITTAAPVERQEAVRTPVERAAPMPEAPRPAPAPEASAPEAPRPAPARPRVLVKLPTAVPDPIPAKDRNEALERIRKVLCELGEETARKALLESLLERFSAVSDRRAAVEKLLDEELPRPPEPEPEPVPPPEDPAVRRERLLVAVAERLSLSNKDLAESLYGDGSAPACRKAAAARKRHRARLDSEEDSE